MAARYGKGAKLQYETSPGSGTFQTVTGCKNIDGPDNEIDEVDATDHDTPGNFKAFVSGPQDPGRLSAEVHFDPIDATHAQLVLDKNAGTNRLWRVRWQVGAQFVHEKANGFVKQWAAKSPSDALLTRNLVVRLTGETTFVVEP